MENFIREGKSGFDFLLTAVIQKIVNANSLRVHALAYNPFNRFKNLALAVNMRRQTVDTLWLKISKVAAKAVIQRDTPF